MQQVEEGGKVGKTIKLHKNRWAVSTAQNLKGRHTLAQEMPAKRAAAVKKEDDREEDAAKGGDGAHEPSSPYEFSLL